MSYNTFGKIFRFTTWGESHGPAIGCVVDGCPPNIEIKESEDFTLTFVFQDSSYNVISKHLENNELNLILSEIRRENSP